MSETDLQRSIMRGLCALGCMVVRVQSGSFRGAGGWVSGAKKGTPDLVVLDRQARVTFVEVKTDEGEPSEAQREWHAQALALGHRVAVVRSVREAVEAVRR
jgi:Holliday junction resolvase